MLLFFGVSGVLYNLLHHNIEPQLEVSEYSPPKQDLIKQEKNSKAWIEDMAQKNAREFIFPVNELFMQIDSFGEKKDGMVKLKTFRLVIDKLDRYSLFCIIQTLTSLHMPYMVVKDEKSPMIYIEEKNEKLLDKVLVELEKYDIKSKIVEVWL